MGSAPTTTIRVRLATREALSAMARREGRTITDVVARLVADQEANALFDQHTAAMAQVASSPTGRAELDAEQRLLDGTLRDGLEDDPWPVDEDGSPAR